MQINWSELKARYEEINQKLLSPSLDNQQRQELQREHTHLSTLLKIYKRIEELEQLLSSSLQELAKNQGTELADLYQEEITEAQQALQQKNQELEDILFPPDPLDNRSVFLEIRAGTGGQEAALFAADLVKMYTNYALTKRWHVELADCSTTDLGGIREAILHIEGKGVYGHLRYESGVHRVQRVPKTETAGRVHTSTATVAVLPEAQEVDVVINPADLRVDTYRASGAGGQHVNKTDSAIRITHIPTGIVVACQEDRSQHKNRAKAMKMLQSRILAAQREKQEMEQSQKRKEMVGTGMRAEKVRTYNFPQNRISDHQVDLTLKNLDVVIEGSLDEIIDALMKKGREDRKKMLSPTK
jgi:peptide chain release factor 1